VAAEYDTRGSVAQPLDGRKGGTDTGIVTDCPAFKRHIEVNPAEHALAPHVR
jgi:hypothetical protein